MAVPEWLVLEHGTYSVTKLGPGPVQQDGKLDSWSQCLGLDFIERPPNTIS